MIIKKGKAQHRLLIFFYYNLPVLLIKISSKKKKGSREGGVKGRDVAN